MILGVDHLALSTIDLEQDCLHLEVAGVRPKFLQRAIPNSPLKREFLAAYEPLHSIAFCPAKAGVAIELTQHGERLISGRSPLQVYMNQPPPGSRQAEPSDPGLPFIWRAALGCDSPELCVWTGLKAAFWVDRNLPVSPFTGVRAVLVPVVDLSRASRFWQSGLGCRQEAQSQVDGTLRWGRFAFRSPVPAWSLTLILAECEQPNLVPFLDTNGFPCLALLSSNLERDCERVCQAGAIGMSQPFCVSINNKRLRVVILRGPDQELIELIQVGDAGDGAK